MVLSVLSLSDSGLSLVGSLVKGQVLTVNRDSKPLAAGGTEGPGVPLRKALIQADETSDRLRTLPTKPRTAFHVRR